MNDCDLMALSYSNDDVDAIIGIRLESRYEYELLLTKEEGWYPFSTDADALSFGIWVNVIDMKIFMYADGNRELAVYSTSDALKQRLDEMEKSYGPFPSMSNDRNENGVCKQYDDIRPSSSNIIELKAVCTRKIL